MLLNQFHESGSGEILEFNSRDVIRALNDDMTSALHQLCQVMDQFGVDRLFNSLRSNNRFVYDYDSMNVENLINTLRMYYVLDTDEDFSVYAAESDRVIDQIAECANDAFFGSKTEARIKELGCSLSEPVITEYQCRHTDMVNDKISDYCYDLRMHVVVQGDMEYSNIVNTLFTNTAFKHAVMHGATWSMTKYPCSPDDVYRVPSYVINLTATFEQLALDKCSAVYNFIDVAKFCLTRFGFKNINDLSGMQLELLAREAVRVTC